MTNTQSHLVCGPVRVTWRADDSVDTVTYEGVPLGEAVNRRFQNFAVGPSGINLTSEQCQMIDSLLDLIAALPPSEKRRKICLADKIFEHLNLRMLPPNPSLEQWLRTAILNQVWRWEDSHEKIHKGTLYYFMATTYLGLGDIPSAYISFFSALQDDKENFPYIPKNLKDAPAYLTTSLVDNPNNYLYNLVVVPLRAYLQRFINGYNSRTKRNLSIRDLDEKFLQADPLEDIKRFFVANLHEIYHLSPLNSSRMINNDYSKLKIIDTIFNVALVIDQILEHRFLQNVDKKEKTMGNAVYHLALYLSWTTTKDSSDAREFLKKVQPNLNEGPPDKILPTLLDGTATYDGGPLDALMRAIFAAYHLRNYGGHNIEGSNKLVERYDEIINLVMNAFFVSIEVL